MTSGITSKGASAAPRAIPIKGFGYGVYSWICKHLYLYPRSRRTRLAQDDVFIISQLCKRTHQVLMAHHEPPIYEFHW